MNWGRGGKGDAPTKQLQQQPGPEADGRGRFAAPPPGPRCDLTKSQARCCVLCLSPGLVLLRAHLALGARASCTSDAVAARAQHNTAHTHTREHR